MIRNLADLDRALRDSFSNIKKDIEFLKKKEDRNSALRDEIRFMQKEIKKIKKKLKIK
ncbi:MAG: hypothetical protein Q7J54_06625 [Candidatus Woesearchaeota archaeon]|nr:hypothetical protein [Candidatus Woesearchaeota archaeon]